MIVFDLECINGHTFEGWFDGKDDLDRQIREKILACPVCDSTHVSQKVHAISIKRSSSCGSAPSQRALQAGYDAIKEMTEKVGEYVEKNFEDVGTDFSKQALNMHYGVEAHRNIRGTTTKEEDKQLEKEGVPVFKVPLPKKSGDDLN